MLKRFEVENFMNFKKRITIDFSKVGGYQFNKDCITDGLISKMIIYGRNATGKTNLGNAIFDIREILPISNNYRYREDFYINADSLKTYAMFKYVFQFEDDEVIYQYEKDKNHQMHVEELILNNIRIFYYNFETKESDFNNLSLIGADTIVLDRYFQIMNESDERNENLPFLKWALNNMVLSGDSVLFKIERYVMYMGGVSAGMALFKESNYISDSLIKILEKEDNLSDFEDFLNAMGIRCELILIPVAGKNQLYFKHEIPIPFFKTASSGTLALANIYRRLQISRQASLLYLDEFDAFYHYEMSDRMLQFFKKRYPKCQFILTTHNTNLMANSKMRPDCLFILSSYGSLTPLCAATNRELREGHNLEKLYISGEFEKYE